ncbi:unnamed protein product [Citrullus colocynthis]|uniref:Uncharacterized protein n=1 Tax=Citrullus colocynthis TaxID=252529 RepID=A0ABP0YTB7_9ROSI
MAIMEAFNLSPLLLSFFLFALFQTSTIATKKSYIVYLGSHSHGLNPSSIDIQLATESHYNLLGSLLGSNEAAKEAIFYSYNRHINGFAAVLDQKVAEDLAKHPDVVSVHGNKGRKLHTTHSWNFLGVENDGAIPSNSIWNLASFGESTIIANLDTGVWPESKSFNDEGYGPIPTRWKGSCEGGSKFHCNSTVDRLFTSYVALGDKRHNKGASLSDKILPAQKFYPLISAVDAKANNVSNDDAIGSQTSTDYGFILLERSQHNRSLNTQDLNYPSISIPELKSEAVMKVKRRVKNVGSPGTYVVQVDAPLGVSVSVEPTSLKFTGVDEEKNFRVVLRSSVPNDFHGKYVFGRLEWSDGNHHLGSKRRVKEEKRKRLLPSSSASVPRLPFRPLDLQLLSSFSHFPSTTLPRSLTVDFALLSG